MHKFVLVGAFTALFSLSSTAMAFNANVFGDDDRKELRDVKHPWSTIGRLDAPDNRICTATLVGRDLIITAAHCVIDGETQALAKGSYTFYPSLTDGKYKVSSRVKHFWWGTKNPNGEPSKDWAIGRLADPLGDKLGWMGVYPQDLSKMMNQKNLLLVGYSADLKKASSAHWVNRCSFTNWNHMFQGVASHDCDMTSGASGGPMIWQGDEKKLWIVGINTAELRPKESPKSLVGIPYSDGRANIAIPTGGFLELLRRLKGNNEGR